jgi:hypothetical protein
MLFRVTCSHMLTQEKLDAYRRFGGDIDGYARSHGRGDASGITDEDWALIDELRGALFIVAPGKASPEFAASVQRRLQVAAVDLETCQQMQFLAQKA